MNKLSLKQLKEEAFLMDTPESFSAFLVSKFKKGELDQFFGDPKFIKKWKLDRLGRKAFPGFKKTKDDVTGEKRPMYPLSGEKPADRRDKERQPWHDLADPDAVEKGRPINYEEGEMPPNEVIERMTMPDDKFGKFTNYVFVNMSDPDPGESLLTKEERQKVNKVIERMQSMPEDQRPRYLFNIMMMATGLNKPKKEKGPAERSPLKAITKAPEEMPKASNYKHQFKPYRSKKQRGEN